MRVLMQSLSVRARTREPGGDSGLPVALRPAELRKDPAHEPRAVSTTATRHERVFSSGTKGYDAGQ